MKKTALVLLVSEQTIPNFLSIKIFDKCDYFVFITTSKVEDPDKGNRRNWIIKATKISEDNTDFIIVEPDNYESVYDALVNYDWNQFKEVNVNITGGTKMMSIASFDFFRDKTSKIWYKPIDKEYYLQVKNVANQHPVSYQMNVEEYLDCCGIIKDERRYSKKKTMSNFNTTVEIFNKFLEKRIDEESLNLFRLMYRADKKELEMKIGKIKSENNYINNDKLSILEKSIQKNERTKLQRRSIVIENNYIVENVFNIFGMKFPQDNVLNIKEVEYITGGWFEEFCLHSLKEILGKDDSYFKLGVVLNPKPKDVEKASYFTKNDLDVVLTYNNDFYVVECKTGGMDITELYNKTIYLASALKKYFGLTVKSVLFTLSEVDNKKKDKAQTLGVMVIDRNDLMREDYLQVIAEKLNFKTHVHQPN